MFELNFKDWIILAVIICFAYFSFYLLLIFTIYRVIVTIEI